MTQGTININPVDEGSWPIQTTLRLQASFFLTDTGQLANPTTVLLYLTPPNQPQQTTAAVVLVSTGVFTYTFTPMISGLWLGTWQGTGAVAATRDFTFNVLPSSNIPG